jgi:hypothetical protein
MRVRAEPVHVEPVLVYIFGAERRTRHRILTFLAPCNGTIFGVLLVREGKSSRGGFVRPRVRRGRGICACRL